MFILLLAHCCLTFLEHPIVSINQGLIKGVKLLSRSGRQFSAFRRIPYGQVNTRFSEVSYLNLYCLSTFTNCGIKTILYYCLFENTRHLSNSKFAILVK